MLYTRFKIICLLFLLISFYLIGCSTKEPSDDLIKRQISGLLTKDTTGKLFDVTSVQIESKHLTKEGDFIVNAQYTLRYTSSLADYLTYLFENTNIDSRIDGAEVESGQPVDEQPGVRIVEALIDQESADVEDGRS